MRVLVTAASKHGGTAEIAAAIGRALAEHAVDVEVTAIEDTAGVENYGAVVLGSAVYAGHWLESATEFVEDHATQLAGRPVWLFSSGPIGVPPKPAEDPVDAAQRCSSSCVEVGLQRRSSATFVSPQDVRTGKPVPRTPLPSPGGGG